MANVITMGEIMLRLSTPNNERLLQADELDVCYGGGEANVAVSLAGFGHNTQFVTKLPKNPLGDCACAALRKMNVGTDFVARGGERLGIYFLETGSAMRPSGVVYDRAHSSMSEAEACDFDWERIFKGADLFHFSGITPAISAKAATLATEAVKAAKKAGALVSCDINYRSKLWTFEEAQKTMMTLMPYVDWFFGSAGDGKMVLGEPKESAFGGSRSFNEEMDRKVYERLVNEFGFSYIISSERESVSASDNGLSACLYNGKTKELIYSKKYRITPIVDRVGGGDALTGGVLCGLLEKRSDADALEFGVAASALKHTIRGDFNIVRRDEVELLRGGDQSGRVQR